VCADAKKKAEKPPNIGRKKGVNVLTVPEKIMAALGLTATPHDGAMRIGRNLIVNVGGTLVPYIIPEVLDGFSDLQVDTGYDGALLAKLQDIKDGVTDHLEEGEIAALAEAVAEDSFKYLAIWRAMPEAAKAQFFISMFQDRYQANPAYLSEWHTLMADSGWAAKLAAMKAAEDG
jgi:hypothetical protein